MNRRQFLLGLTAALLLGGCGYQFGYRHFAGPILPTAEQGMSLIVSDDRSITFIQDRLEVSLRPLTPDMLNRHFPAQSARHEGFYQPPSAAPINPYTYGDWIPPGEDSAPARFVVFHLRVKNYAFPKVRIDPTRIHLSAANGRRYPALSLFALVEYYWPYAVAYTGKAYQYFQERRDILRRTLFQDEMIFSGQEREGYVVFPTLDLDVEEFTIWIEGIALRFDYRDQPVETTDVAYRFYREVYLARQPRTAEPPLIK